MAQNDTYTPVSTVGPSRTNLPLFQESPGNNSPCSNPLMAQRDTEAQLEYMLVLLDSIQANLNTLESKVLACCHQALEGGKDVQR
jgi:hypothetical protein